MVRLVRRGEHDKARTYRSAVVMGMVTMLVAGVGLIWSGDWQAKLMFDQQPMKMAAAEALCETQDGAAFSILTIGDLSNSCEGVRHVIEMPGFTSFLATGDFDATIKGVDDLQREYEEQFGFTDEAGNPISYQPNLAVTYWSFRLMIGLAVFSAVLALAALWLTRKGRMTDNVWFARLGVLAIPMPFLASSFGWIFTEMGRQPWVVVPNPNPSGVDGVWLLTAQGVSEVTSVGHVAGSLVAFTALYGVLAVIWYRLMHRYAVEGIAETSDSPTPDQDADAPLSFAY